MWKAMKSYCAFTNWKYRLVMFVIVPMIFLLVQGCLPKMEVVGQYDNVIIILLEVVYITDTLADSKFMGGFYAKNNSCLEFLQSSNYFQTFARNIVIIDIVRRILLYVGLFGLGTWIGLAKGYSKEGYRMSSYLPFLEMFFAQISVLIGRHFVTWQPTYLCAMIGFLLSMILGPVIIVGALEKTMVVNVIFAILMVLVSIGTVCHTQKKVRDSFYDR